MQNLINNRKRRASATRAKLKDLKSIRLSIHRTNSHIYAQVIDKNNCNIIAAASSLEPLLKKQLENGGNVEAATLVGRYIAERAINNGVNAVAFDRSGYKYHGRVKALAQSARENGLNF